MPYLLRNDGVCSNVYTLIEMQGATMAITTLTSREFNQHASEAKKAANNGPVFITDRGCPAHVLLSIKDYQRITGGHQKIADLLAMPGIEDVEFDIPKMRDLARSADLS